MNWLEPEPTFIPTVRSLEGFRGQRIAFNIGGYWQYYPSFADEPEYQDALELIVQGAWLALADESSEAMVGVSTDPYGVHWSDYLLPLWNWNPAEGSDPEWHPSVVKYAQLFESGCVSRDYTGGCVSRVPELTLRRCADLVLRNYAPYSWLFSPLQGGISLYFHNTTSFGVCVPDGPTDVRTLIAKLERLGLEACSVG